jgi:hypothetical protein
VSAPGRGAGGARGAPGTGLALPGGTGDHDDVASSWSGQRRCHIVVVVPGLRRVTGEGYGTDAPAEVPAGSTGAARQSPGLSHSRREEEKTGLSFKKSRTHGTSTTMGPGTSDAAVTEVRIVAAALRHGRKLTLNTESALATTPHLGTNGQSASCSSGLAAAVAMP